MRFIALLTLHVALITVPLFAAPPSLSPAQAQSQRLNEQGVSATESGKLPEAERLFSDALKIDQGNVTAVFNLAGVLIREKREYEAIALLRSYTARIPQDVGLWVRLGDAYFGSKQVAEAISVYETAYSLDEKFTELTKKLGMAYAVARRFSDAERVMFRGVEIDPQNEELLANLSSIFLLNGKPDKAVSTAKRALQINATPELYATLGTAYEAQLDLKNALIAYQRAEDLGHPGAEISAKINALQAQIAKE